MSSSDLPEKRRRTRLDPNPRFKPDRSAEVDPLWGAPEYQVPPEHLARRVKAWVEPLDLSAVEANYSSLGRRGNAPRCLLGVWIYASLIGLHHATKVEHALKTDAAFRLLSGGWDISATILRDFRRDNLALFEQCIEQVTALAVEDGLLDPDRCAVDSLRLRAHASSASVRTVERSTARLKQLQSIDRDALTEDEQTVHDQKLDKHQAALAHCEQKGKTIYSTTNPEASLMKFPSGAAHPGHRVTVVASRSDLRFIVCLLLHDTANDYGLLGAACQAARQALRKAGVPEPCRVQASADAGYFSESDLRFARDHQEWLDVLIK